MSMRFLLSILAALALPCLAHAAVPPLDFQRDVRPILSQHCYQCHGPDDTARKAGLRLDIREQALKPTKSDSIAIVPGKPDTSELIGRIFSHDEDELMPPPATKKPLSDEQRATLRRWVAEGAIYTPHWAYVKPVSPPVPKITDTTARIANPIDSFILAELPKHGLHQSPQADRTTLARRVALDLTGLPPTPEVLAAFVKDDRADAYERYVDTLLRSPHYGERWARRWLDLARYADTNGYEKDRARSIWPYRDWVIEALNADMPFDEFTIEQLAGDMLPKATPAQIIATGFNRNTMLNEEGGIDPLEYRFAAMVDRVATTSATWLGLTMQCCQCHTHKYDPITHTEYYGLMAFLNNADEPLYDIPSATDKNTASDRQHHADQALAALLAKHQQTAAPDFAKWLDEQRVIAVKWQTMVPVKATSNMPLLTVQPDGSVLGSGDITKNDTYNIVCKTDAQQPLTALRLEALPHPSLPAHGPGMCYYEGPLGDFFMGEIRVTVDGQPVKIAKASESYAKNNFGKNDVSAMLATDGDAQTGWSCAAHYGERDEAVFVFEHPIKASELRVTMQFGRHYACPLGYFRLSATTDTRPAKAMDMEASTAALLTLPDALLSAEQRQTLFTQFVLTSPSFAKEAQPILDLRKPLPTTTTLVMRERPADNPRITHRQHRGEFTQPKEEVQPITLSMLHPFPKDQPRNRLGLARWLVSPENPLTPRVVMNRQWATLFGRGIVKTVEDYGYQGDAPTHPELLDWLATEFIKRGWSMKAMHKLMVMSETYRQASEGNAQAPVELLARFPRIRLDAEVIRDSLLVASGLLNPNLGGKSVFPPQPDSVTEVAYGAFKWTPSVGPDRYRRSLYTFAKRTAPFAMSTTFDGPTGEACLVKRETSNTPLQALTTLNDILFIEAAQALGSKLAAIPGDDAAKTRELYQRVLARTPDADELRLMQSFVAGQRTRLQQGELVAAEVSGVKDATAVEAAAWTLAARTMFNLDEFMTKG